MTKRLLLPVLDDSTLFFAKRFREVMKPLDCACNIGLIADSSSLSERQLQSNLPEGPDALIQNNAFRDPGNFASYDAIVTSRPFRLLSDMIRRPVVRMAANRPVVISFQGGLDFTPDRGFKNRKNSDAVFIVPKPDIDSYYQFAKENDYDWQYVDFGHPTFISPKLEPVSRSSDGDIYFFAQAISPLTKNSRLHILEMLEVLALKNPDKTVWIKLRHLPNENSKHLHKEEFDYPGLMKSFPRALPANLKYTACTMDEAIEGASLGITCTSTAAIDLVRAGVPTQIYLDYLENYIDPLCDPMKRLFASSRLICSLTEILEGQTQEPDSSWLNDMFCSDDLGQRVLDAITRVREKRPGVKTVIPPF